MIFPKTWRIAKYVRYLFPSICPVTRLHIMLMRVNREWWHMHCPTRDDKLMWWNHSMNRRRWCTVLSQCTFNLVSIVVPFSIDRILPLRFKAPQWSANLFIDPLTSQLVTRVINNPKVIIVIISLCHLAKWYINLQALLKELIDICIIHKENTQKYVIDFMSWFSVLRFIILLLCCHYIVTCQTYGDLNSPLPLSWAKATGRGSALVETYLFFNFK